MKTQTDPKVDYAFKHVFGREESKPALVSLLNAVLQPAAGEGIVGLELLNPFNAKAFESAKTCIVDIKARSPLDLRTTRAPPSDALYRSIGVAYPGITEVQERN
jgi:hypothetical protein